jgi:predicted dehydrogenase
MGLNVVALCDGNLERAESRRREFFPAASTYTDYKQILWRDDIEVVDLATHAQDRDYLIPEAIKAGKHVLSQKPFVSNLTRGERLVEMADKRGVQLAINQNGRWAPHFSYMRQAVKKGLVGDVAAVHLAVHWDHEWIKETAFNGLHHVVLYDFAIHWFDMVQCLMRGRRARRVFATLARAGHQVAKPPLLGQALIEFDGAQASLAFDGATKFGHLDQSYVMGSKGTILSRGPDLKAQAVSIHTAKGVGWPQLKGTWFSEGFMGTMGELLSAIEQKRTPINNAAENLKGLAICFAAVQSAQSERPEVVGKIRRVPTETCQVARRSATR